jgi:hypothetical protein
VIAMLAFHLRRWWWRRFSPFVRAGWIVMRTEGGPIRRQALIGAGLMALGLMLRPRRREVLYSQALGADGAVTVRVAQGGRVVNTG